MGLNDPSQMCTQHHPVLSFDAFSTKLHGNLFPFPLWYILHFLFLANVIS